MFKNKGSKVIKGQLLKSSIISVVWSRTAVFWHSDIKLTSDFRFFLKRNMTLSNICRNQILSLVPHILDEKMEVSVL